MAIFYDGFALSNRVAQLEPRLGLYGRAVSCPGAALHSRSPGHALSDVSTLGTDLRI